MRLCVKNLFQGVVATLVQVFCPVVSPRAHCRFPVPSWSNQVKLFFKPRDGPGPTLENVTSLFAQTVKHRRREEERHRQEEE